MDPALKKRLVGAIVLVVLAVAFLPMVFDGRERTTTEAIDLTVPPVPDREFETRVVPLQPPGSPSQPVAPPDLSGIVTVDADDQRPPDALAGQEPQATPAPVSAPAPAAASPATTPPEPVAAAPAAAAAAPAPVATIPAAAAPAPSAQQPAAAPSVSLRGRYVVNFGSYSRAENASALVAALKQGGIPAYAENVTVGGKPGQRVRSGPYADRAEAEKARLLAKKARSDVPGTIVEVDDVARADQPESRAGGMTTGWAVQVGAFQDQAEANGQRDKLRGAGFAAFVDPVRTEKGTLYRVRVGPETLRQNAEKLRDAVKARFRLDGLVVAHP